MVLARAQRRGPSPPLRANRRQGEGRGAARQSAAAVGRLHQSKQPPQLHCQGQVAWVIGGQESVPALQLDVGSKAVPQAQLGQEGSGGQLAGQHNTLGHCEMVAFRQSHLEVPLQQRDRSNLQASNPCNQLPSKAKKCLSRPTLT